MFFNEVSEIDWRRLASGLRQRAKSSGITAEQVSQVLEVMHNLAEVCGDFSRSGKMLLRIAFAVARGPLSIIAPACPDYTHRDGRYTFRGVGGGLSLLAQKHIQFLLGIQELVAVEGVVILIADQEAEDWALCQAARVSQDRFCELIKMSIVATQEEVGRLGWHAEAMTARIPDLKEREAEAADWIGKEPAFSDRIRTDTIQRGRMYALIGDFSPEQARARTIRTSSQYVALGRYAASCNLLITNHTTTNLAWYLKTEAAVLHNPVNVY